MFRNSCKHIRFHPLSVWVAYSYPTLRVTLDRSIVSFVLQPMLSIYRVQPTIVTHMMVTFRGDNALLCRILYNPVPGGGGSDLPIRGDHNFNRTFSVGENWNNDIYGSRGAGQPNDLDRDPPNPARTFSNVINGRIFGTRGSTAPSSAGPRRHVATTPQRRGQPWEFNLKGGDPSKNVSDVRWEFCT